MSAVISPGTFAKHLAAFEEKFAGQIAELKLMQFQAWQLVKTPIYFSILNQLTDGGAAQAALPKQSFIKSLWRRGTGVLSVFTAFTALWMKCGLRSNSKRVLFYTFSADKLAKDAQGGYFNYLADGFITNQLTENFVYAELSHNGAFRTPSRVKADFKADHIYKLSSWYIARNSNEAAINNVAAKLAELLNNFFQESGSGIAITEQQLAGWLRMFAAQHAAGIRFLKIAKPQLIIASELVATGFLAAAIELGIPAIDLQHGLIDYYHPTYTYSNRLLPFKQDMVLPRWIGVFGALHKKILLSMHFWKEDEIILLGNARMNLSREKYNPAARAAGNTILFPTQWTFFNESLQVLQALVKELPDNVKILLKMHPMERDAFIKAYNELAAAHPSKITIASREDDIYPMIYASRMVIGFDSTVLFEAIAMGVPCITITTPALPAGVHSLINVFDLEEVIKPVPVDDAEKLKEIVVRAFTDEAYYKNWCIECVAKGEMLYANDYFSNSRQFMQQAFSAA